MNQAVKPNTPKTPEVKEVAHVEAENLLSETHILLPTHTSASGICINKTEYIVVDGITPYAYFYSFCGVFKGAVHTLRAYSQLVYNMETDSYFALGSRCATDVYTLNCRLEETGTFQAECGKSLVGISLYNQSGGECQPCFYNCDSQLLLTSLHEISAYTQSGSFLNSFERCSNDVYLKSFVRTQNGYAEGYEKNGSTYIRIVLNCAEAEAVLPRCTTLKNIFVTDGGGIYGFFSKNYYNNFVVPLYENETVMPALKNCNVLRLKV